MTPKPSLYFIVGATATGKSQLAMESIRNWGGEILNCDSIQIFKSLDIGSAKPSLEERAKCPHHLVDFVEEGQGYTAGDFRRDALKTLEEATQRGIPNIFIVGGSGFYVNALKYGLYDIPKVPQEIHEEVKTLNLEEAFRELEERDPEYAQKISSNDFYRVCRALEVIRHTEKKFSEIQGKFQRDELPYEFKTIGLRCDKEFLRGRVRKRAQAMLQAGWQQEVTALLEKGLESWSPMSSVGYREMVAYLKGELPEDQLEEEIVKNTMKLVKKQNTWFKKDTETQWFDCELGLKQAMEYIHHSQKSKESR